MARTASRRRSIWGDTGGCQGGSGRTAPSRHSPPQRERRPWWAGLATPAGLPPDPLSQDGAVDATPGLTGCPLTPPASAHWAPEAPHPLSRDARTVPSHCQSSSQGKVPWGRTTNVPDTEGLRFLKGRIHPRGEGTVPPTTVRQRVASAKPHTSAPAPCQARSAQGQRNGPAWGRGGCGRGEPGAGEAGPGHWRNCVSPARGQAAPRTQPATQEKPSSVSNKGDRPPPGSRPRLPGHVLGRGCCRLWQWEASRCHRGPAAKGPCAPRSARRGRGRGRLGEVRCARGSGPPGGRPGVRDTFL